MRRGFTLVELVVVLAVLGVLGGAAAPAFARLSSEEPGASTTRELLDLLRGARLEALQRGQPVSAHVDVRSGRYWILTRGVRGPGGTRTGLLEVAPDAELKSQGPRATFVFDPTGPARGDSIVVTTGTRRMVVTVDLWTGHPYVR